MAGRTQPIVYKPTNVTKYADAYVNRLDAAAAEAKKQQAERDKRRQKMSDELDVSMAGTFVAPAAQDAWDMYREEKMKYLQENPDKIKRVIEEAAEYKKTLGGIDTEYRNKSASIDPSTQHGVDYAMRESVKGLPEGADYNDIDQVLKAALSPFNMVTDKQDLDKGISDTMAAVLEDIYNSDEKDDFFVEDETITNSGDGYESTKFARNIIPTQKEEVARRVFARLEDKYLIEAGFRAEYDNDFNLEEEISQRAMGLAPFAGRKIEKDDGRGRGYDDINPKIYREMIRTGDTKGLDALKGAKIQNRDIISASYSPDGKDVELIVRNVKSTKDGLVEEQLPMTVAVDDVDMWDNILRSRYRYDPKKWETLEEPAGYSGTPKDYTQDVKDVHNALYEVSVSDKSPDEKTKEFQRILGRKDVEYNTVPSSDITIGDQDLDLFYMVGRDKKKLKEKFGQLIWETKDSWDLSGVKKEEGILD